MRLALGAKRCVATLSFLLFDVAFAIAPPFTGVTLAAHREI